MRYNTGNPVEPNGSSDPRDLYDTAAIADLLVNGPLGEYLSRLGVPLKSWQGIMKQVTDYLIAQGYESVYLTYGAGVVVDRQTQLVQRSGELYRVINASDIPLTLTGTWATDSLKLQAVGDASLRQVLASPDGWKYVGAGTYASIEQAFNDLSSGVDQKTADIRAITDNTFSNALEPAVIDLHFTTLQGVGWTNSEPGLIVEKTVTGSTVNTITVDSATGLYSGQLISYFATDGQYYTCVIKLIGTVTLTMSAPLPKEVAVGSKLYNFYRDDAHGNKYGFNAVADDALRQLTSNRLFRTEYHAKDAAIWSPVSGATLTTLTTTSYDNPGAGLIGERGVLVQSSAIGAGAESSLVSLIGGDYETVIFLNPGIRDGNFTGFLNISVVEVTSSGNSETIVNAQIINSYGSARAFKARYTVRTGSMVKVIITSPNGGPWRFWIGSMQHNRVGGYLNNLNRGKHVLLGDSWFTSGGDFHNRLISRLDKASVISAGVPGNRASQLISRFAIDVAPQNPDYVWVMVGTNDYYASVSNTDFEQQIHQLRMLIQSIGAQPIFFNATVGAISYTPEQLTKSRSYAVNIRYTGQEIAPNGAGAVARSASISQSITVAAGATVVVGVCPGYTRMPAVARFLTVSNTGLNLSLGYSSTSDGASVVDVTTWTGVGPHKDGLATRADTSLRFPTVRVTNTTGTPVPATVLADICWQQSPV